MIALVLAKVASVSTPLVLGASVNSLAELSSGINLFMLVPVALIVGYGVAKIISFAFVEVRDSQLGNFFSFFFNTKATVAYL